MGEILQIIINIYQIHFNVFILQKKEKIAISKVVLVVVIVKVNPDQYIFRTMCLKPLLLLNVFICILKQTSILLPLFNDWIF